MECEGLGLQSGVAAAETEGLGRSESHGFAANELLAPGQSSQAHVGERGLAALFRVLIDR